MTNTKICKIDLIAQAHQYTQMSTRKRSVMSDHTAKIVVLYAKKFEATQLPINAKGLQEFLMELDVSNNSKAAIGSYLAGMFRKLNFINPEEHTHITNLYRQVNNSWSELDISANDIADLLLNFKYKGHAEMIAFTFLTSALGLRLEQALHITLNDIKLLTDKVEFKIRRQKQNAYTSNDIYETKSIGNTYRVEHTYPVRDGEIDKVFDIYTCLMPQINKRAGVELEDPDALVYLFTLNKRTIQQHFKSYSELSGKKLTPHSMRHYAGNRIANKYGVLKASQLLGHSFISTTQKYISNKIDTSEIIK